MSPPAAAAAPAVHRGRTVAPGAPPPSPRRPRRVSGPVRAPSRHPRHTRPSRPSQPPAQPDRGLALGLLASARGVWQQRLDRLIRGRTWIALIAFALIGIVVLQLLVLKLNASIGRALEREASLQRENAALSIESSELATGSRVETRASALGMQLVPVSALRFLAVRPHLDVVRATSALSSSARSPASGSTEAPGATAEAGGGSAQATTGSAQAAAGATASTSEASTSGEQGAAGAPAGEATSSPSAQTGNASGESGAAGAPASEGPASGTAEAAPAAAAPAASAAGGTESAGAG
jgi:cell division protein FtsL